MFPSVVLIGWYWTFDWVVTVFGWCCAILAGGDFLIRWNNNKSTEKKIEIKGNRLDF